MHETRCCTQSQIPQFSGLIIFIVQKSNSDCYWEHRGGFCGADPEDTDWLWNLKWNSAFITFLSNVKESFTQTGGDDRNSRQVWEQLCPHGLCPCRRLKTPRHFLFFTSPTHCICVFAPEVCLWRLVCGTFCSPASMFLRVTSLYNTSMIEW